MHLNTTQIKDLTNAFKQESKLIIYNVFLIESETLSSLKDMYNQYFSKK